MIIAGVDEVGRGPLAGPVCAAAVILPPGYTNTEIDDSKKLSPAKREQLAVLIRKEALAWSIVSVGHHRIEKLNIRNATKLAMSLAVARVAKTMKPDLIRIDGNMLIDCPLRQETVIGGDAIHIEIAAASIIAKQYRDRLMKVLDEKYPGYGLGGHAGYPTEAHRNAIKCLGPSRIHRTTFRGVREYLLPTESPAGGICRSLG